CPSSIPRRRASPTAARRADSGSETAIDALELRGLAEAAAAALDPVRRPLDQALERDLGRAQQRHALGGVAEEREGSFRALQARSAAEARGEALGPLAQRHDLR